MSEQHDQEREHADQSPSNDSGHEERSDEEEPSSSVLFRVFRTLVILVVLGGVAYALFVPAIGDAMSASKSMQRRNERRMAMRRARKRAQQQSVERRREQMNREDYDHTEANPFRSVTERPRSTFSVDVDTASYANMRRFLKQDRLPPADALRIEELVNYFDYDYPQPDGDHPFSINTELTGCPWKSKHQLLRIGLQGKQVPRKDIPPSNLVFLLDVSGSMGSPKELPLVKKSMKLLTEKLRPEDTVSIVVYAGDSGVALEPTSGDRKYRIKQAISRLDSGGSTAGSEGIRLAYQKAEEQFRPNGNNRVILATDGDFNVGISSDGGLVRLIEEKRESGIFLSVLGVGRGNYQGGKMEKLSNKGNGNYAYLDSIMEARKTLVEEFGGSMMTIAKDVKIQVEFNPAAVKSYRLIGYVNRQLDKEDFRDDSKDAGEIGSDHTVTALYQVVPAGVEAPTSGDVPDLKYQEKEVRAKAKQVDELGTVRFRYKEPDGEKSTLIKETISTEVSETPSADQKWASSVAMFGMELRDSAYGGDVGYEQIRKLAKTVVEKGNSKYRREFLRLVERAETIDMAQ